MQNEPLILTLECGKCGQKVEDIELLPEEKVDIPNSRG